MSDEKWRQVGSVSKIKVDQPLSVEVNGIAIGIYQIGEEYHAIEDVCPHAFAILTEGFIEGCEVECPLHEATFDITNGKLLSGPADRDLQTFPVKTEEGQILVQA